MKIVRNNVIPLPGFRAMTVWPWIFVRKDTGLDDKTMRHEEIHGCQQREMLVVPFFMWYVVEWLLRLVFSKGNAYRKILFEREAYANEDDPAYLERRIPWSWLWRQ